MLTITLPGGGCGRIVETDGNHVTIQVGVSSPPGSTVEIRGDELGSCRIKVRGCKRIDDGEGDSVYRVAGRFVNLSRSQRRLLLSDSQD